MAGSLGFYTEIGPQVSAGCQTAFDISVNSSHIYLPISALVQCTSISHHLPAWPASAVYIVTIALTRSKCLSEEHTLIFTFCLVRTYQLTLPPYIAFSWWHRKTHIQGRKWFWIENWIIYIYIYIYTVLFFLGGRWDRRTPKHFVNLRGESFKILEFPLNQLQTYCGYLCELLSSMSIDCI
jgi:hypothetical protein